MVEKVLITGGAGFVGSHAAEFYAKKGNEVRVLDNLSRFRLLKADDKNSMYNWNYLSKYNNVELIKGDIKNIKDLESAVKDVDLIIHTAAQTAATTSVTNPLEDAYINTIGTLNVLETASKSKKKPVVVYCSTNKVYGENVDELDIWEDKKRYRFKNIKGVSENLSVDLTGHTPYGVSKLSGDSYVQEYAKTYGLKTGVFRMSCIYGTRQFGVEDQGWVAWFAINTLLNRPITIYGDGKQVRDMLYVSDLIEGFDAFIKSDIQHGVFNVGGGAENSMSLLELLDFLEKETGKMSKINYADWRPSDQKVYISDISKIKKDIGWEPKTSPQEGVRKLISWVEENRNIF